MHYLVKFDKDWADEFSVYGFAIFEKLKWDNLYDKLKKNKKKKVSFGFGTNEGWDEESIGGFLDDIKIVPITNEEKTVITKLFGKGDYGVFPDFQEMLNKESSEDE